jgi:UDP-N-acetylmuramoyl-L-alanyl-D-glutamate--2,6-diaminopimelate ligase
VAFPRQTSLTALVASLGQAPPPEAAGVTVAGVSPDTRGLQPGELYVALPGDHVHGAEYIPQAIERGASAVVTERTVEVAVSVPVIVVPDARKALSRLSAEFWGHPSRELRVVGVTGTDGKTTTTFMTAAVLEAGGFSTGFITTVDVKVGDRQWAHSDRTTTPQPPTLHRLLREMVDAGNTHAVIESSSHGLRLSRLDDVAYDVAVLTNVTSEHLELHGTVEQYRLDKSRLFSMLGRGPEKGSGKVGIVNADDPNADLYLRATAGSTLTYGTSRQADVVAEDVRQTPHGLSFRVRTERHGEALVELPMLGAYNVYNALAALCVGLTQGVPLDKCREALGALRGVPGRMEQIREGQPFGVVVDYAHTADALSKVLRTLRPSAEGRLMVVFGSAGERDRAKRPAMGAVAAREADFALLTNEDPRGEDEMSILREIAAGAEAAGAREGEGYALVPDRREAIRAAFERARPGDLVLLAGKGHEESIELADRKLPWSDAGVARELLRELARGDC